MAEQPLVLRATMAAHAIALAIWQALTKAKLLNPDITEAELEAIGRQAGEHATKLEAMDHASAALNSGRAAAAEELAPMIRGARYTSVLDKTSCEPCEEDDTGELLQLDAPGLVHPPNPECEGGGRCRCLLFYELSDEVQLDWEDIAIELAGFNPAEARDFHGRWGKGGFGQAVKKAVGKKSPPSRRSDAELVERRRSAFVHDDQIGAGFPNVKRSTREKILGGFNDTVGKWSAAKDGRGKPIWKRARVKLHHKLIAHFDHGHASQPEGKREALFMAGGGGSGKGYIQDQLDANGNPLIRKPDDHVSINADDFRPLLPEWDAMLQNVDLAASSATHEEASHLAGVLTDVAVARGANVLIDGVGDSGAGKDGEASKFVKKLTSMHDAGYKVRVAYVHQDFETAEKQARSRAIRSGRAVPPDVLAEAHREAANRFAEVAAVPWVEIEVWDNSQKPPKLIAQKAAGGILGTVKGEDKAFDSFIRKGAQVEASPEDKALWNTVNRRGR
jgi:hypothetical protein